MPARESMYVLVTALLLFLGLFVAILTSFLAPIVLGLLIAMFTFPIYHALARWLPGKSVNVAALITVIIATLIIAVPFSGLLTLLAGESIELLGQTQAIATDTNLTRALAPLSARLNIDLASLITRELQPILANLGATISHEVGSLLSNLVRLTLNFFVMVVAAFYFLRDGKKLGQYLIILSPLPTTDEMRLYNTFRDSGLAVFYGNLASALVQGVLGGLGFWVFGLHSPILWGAVMGFLALIPLLGPYLIFIPAGIYLIFSGNVGVAIGFFAYNFLIVSTVDNFIKPKLIGDRLKVHPLLILLAILGGLRLFGILGIVYGPLIVAIFLALLKVYREHLGHGVTVHHIKPTV